MKPIEAVVAKLPPPIMKTLPPRSGLQQSSPDNPNAKRGGEYGQIFAYLTPATEREQSATEILDEIQKEAGTPEGLESAIYQLVRGGPPVGKPISVGVQGKSIRTS